MPQLLEDHVFQASQALEVLNVAQISLAATVIYLKNCIGLTTVIS